MFGTTISEATRHTSRPRHIAEPTRFAAAKAAVIAKGELRGLRTPKRLLTFTGTIPAGVYGRVSL